MAKEKNFKIKLLILLFCLGFFLSDQYQTFRDRYVLSDDVMQATYWMEKFHNRDLFPDDIYVEYSRFLRPYGIKLIYYLLTYFTDPIWGGKILSLILFIIACYLLLVLTASLKNNYFLILGTLFFITNPFILKSFPGGLGRGFCYPLLLLFFTGIIKGNSKIIAFSIILSILFYPLSTVIMISSLSLYHLITRIFKVKTPLFIKDKKYIVGAILFSLGIVVLKVYTKPEFLGPLLSKKEMLSQSLFFSGGRSCYFPFPSYLHYILQYLGKNFWEYFIMVIGAGALFKKNKNYFNLCLTLFLASVFLYFLSEIFFIKLYLPQRYPFYLFPLLRTILMGTGIAYLVAIFKKRSLSYLSAITIFVVIFIISGNNLKPGRGLIYVHPEARAVTEFFKKKPKDIFIIAPPHMGDYISTFSERKVLLKYELTQGWFKNYFKIISTRTLDFFKAYYSNNIQEIRKLAEKYNANYIVIDLKYFDPDFLNSGKIYIAPFNSQILNFLPKERDFAILNLLEKAEFKNQRYYIVNLSILK